MDLHSEHLDLVPLDPHRDASDLHPAWSDPAVLEPLGEKDPTTSVAQTVDRLTAMSAGRGIHVWTVRIAGSADALGVVGMFAAPEENGIAGVTWRLRRDAWGRGIMSEAALVVVEHLLSRPEIRGVEAWINANNTRSLGVARNARMDLRGYLPHADTGYQLVMGRARDDVRPQLLSITPTLPVRAVAETSRLLEEILGFRTGFTYGEPPSFAGLGIDAWSSSPLVHLSEVDDEDEILPVEVYVDTIDADDIHDRAVKAGLTVDGPPSAKPWHRREFTLTIPDGHRFRIGAAL